MKSSQTREDPKILAAAERQMRAWSFSQRIAERTLRVHPPAGRVTQFGPFIAISREAGACGGEIAGLVGRQLGWEVLDRNLLDRVADRSHLARAALELVDETPVYWANGILEPWLDPQGIPHYKYVAHLCRAITAAAHRGNVVFVGRGAQFLLPREQGFAVRIVAPEKYRVAEMMRRHGLSAAKARHFVASVDRGRREFAARFFRRDIDDPHLYDAIINTERFGLAGAAEKICALYRG